MVSRSIALMFAVAFLMSAFAEARRSEPQEKQPPVAFAEPLMRLNGSAYAARLDPYYADFDGDGTIDQLLGVWDRLLVFRNRGTIAKPDFAKPTHYDSVEPSVRLPAG